MSDTQALLQKISSAQIPDSLIPIMIFLQEEIEECGEDVVGLRSQVDDVESQEIMREILEENDKEFNPDDFKEYTQANVELREGHFDHYFQLVEEVNNGEYTNCLKRIQSKLFAMEEGEKMMERIGKKQPRNSLYQKAFTHQKERLRALVELLKQIGQM